MGFWLLGIIHDGDNVLSFEIELFPVIHLGLLEVPRFMSRFDNQLVSQFVRFYFSKLILGNFDIIKGAEIMHWRCM